MEQPVTFLDAFVVAFFVLGGMVGGYITFKVLMGFIRGMPRQ